MRLAILGIAAVFVLALGAVGIQRASSLLSQTPSSSSVARQDGPMPTPLVYNNAPPVTLAPIPPPTPSYNYTWDPNRHDQCFDPKDPDLPANAPRCPLPVPPDPGGPKPICPSGTTLVYPNNQPACLPTQPTH